MAEKREAQPATAAEPPGSAGPDRSVPSDRSVGSPSADDAEAYETLNTLAAKMPAGFTREATEAAVDQLVAAGVLRAEPGPAGERRFRYTNPERYRLADAPVVRVPGPDFGRR